MSDPQTNPANATAHIDAFVAVDDYGVRLSITLRGRSPRATLRVTDTGPDGEAVEMEPSIASLWELRDWLVENLPDEC